MRIPLKVVDKLMFDSLHTCCLCRKANAPVDIHHLDGNNKNSNPDNLCVLCKNCHASAESNHGTGRKMTKGEILRYKRGWEELVREDRSRKLNPKDIDVKMHENSSKFNLANYPSFFIKGADCNFNFVVGETAPAEHVISAVDIAASIAVFEDKKITIPPALLDSEVVDISNNNFISIGNPEINSVTRRIMDLPYVISLKLEENKGIIKLYKTGDKTLGLVILGADPLMIRIASRVLANYEDYELSGDEVEITGTDLKDISVMYQT